MIWYLNGDPLTKNQQCAVPLGVQGENATLVYTAGCSDWLEEWPDGIIALLLKAPDGSDPYVADTATDAQTGTVTWTVSAFDTAIPGYGWGELRLVQGDAVKKSFTFRTYIRPSILADAGDPPTPTPDWVDDLLEEASGAMAETRANAELAADAADDAGAAKAAAEVAQGRAEDAAEAAERAISGATSDAEAWANGTRDGEPVTSGDPAYHNNAKYHAEQAGTSEIGAAASAVAAENGAKDAEAWAKGTRNGTPVGSGDPAYNANAKHYADQAAAEAAAVDEEAEDAEAWAKGTRNGTPVGSSDPAYENNAAYYADLAATEAGAVETEVESAEAWAAGTRNGVAVDSSDPAYQNNAKYYKDQAAAVAVGSVGIVADAYDATATYEVGSYAIHEGGLYVCTTAITTAEQWTAAHWKQVTAGSELKRDREDLDKLLPINRALDVTITSGKYIKYTDGSRTNSTAAAHTDFIDITGCTKILYTRCKYTGSSSYWGMAFYASDKSTYVGGQRQLLSQTENGYKLEEITVPENAAYVRLTLRKDIPTTPEVYDAADYHAKISGRMDAAEADIDALDAKTDATNAFVDSYLTTPEKVCYKGAFALGEYGGFSNVNYAMKTVEHLTFAYPVEISVPGPFAMITYNYGTSTRVARDNYYRVPANTEFGVAIAYRNHDEMTEAVARANLLFTRPVSTRRFEETFSSPGIFGTFAVIGDSYSLGSMHWGESGYKGYPKYSWAKLMCNRHGTECKLYSHGGYGIKSWLTNILPTVLTDDPADIYWWGLGINDADDARDPTKVGSLDDLASGDYMQYPDTVYGNYARAYEQVKAHAPLAKHVFVGCIGTTPNHRYDSASYKPINTVFSDLAEHYGVPFIDLVDDYFYTSAYYRDQIRGNHPTLIGYGGMSYANERLLNRCISANLSYFVDYGRTDNPDDVEPEEESNG